MAIILITGTPGSGKTLYAMSKIQEALKTGRPVFTNIEDCKLEGVQPIPKNNNNEEDWTLTPSGDLSSEKFGSLIVYDEAQKNDFFCYKKGEKLSNHHIIKDMETHRHKAYDIILITQSPKFLHLHFLELVSEHYHVIRRFNRNQAEIHLYRKAEYNVGSKASFERSEDSFAWNYDKKLFDKYKSTVAVTNKDFRFSSKMKKSFYIIGGILLLMIYFLFKDTTLLQTAVGIEQEKKIVSGDKTVSSSNNISSEKVEKKSVQELSSENEELKSKLAEIEKQLVSIKQTQFEYNVEQPFNMNVAYQYEIVEKPRIVGCILENKKCSCYTQQATVIKMSYSDCKEYTLNRPFNPFFSNQNNTVNISNNITNDIVDDLTVESSDVKSESKLENAKVNLHGDKEDNVKVVE